RAEREHEHEPPEHHIHLHGTATRTGSAPAHAAYNAPPPPSTFGGIVMRLSTLGRRARLGAWVLWLLAVPVASRASIAPDAQAVVKRYLAAIGGRDAVMRERAVHLKGTLQAFGL